MPDASLPAILLVENDEDTRRLFADSLTVTGLPLIEAGNAYEAFAALRSRRIRLIITDIGMPGGGVEYLANLSRLGPGCPILAISGLGGTRLRENAIQAGVSAFLEKPIRTKQLQDFVRHWIGALNHAAPTIDRQHPRVRVPAVSEWCAGRVEVLLAEAYGGLRKALHDLLQDTDEYHCEVVGTDKKLWDQLSRQDWHVLILDLRLPQHTKMKTVQVVHHCHSKLPILVLSFDEHLAAVRWQEAGAAGFVPKSQLSTDLALAVKTLRRGETYFVGMGAAGTTR